MQPATNTKLAAFYFLSGDEELLLQELRDRICKEAYAAGFSPRQIVTIESIADWQTFLNMTQNQGLFEELQVIDVRNPFTKFDKTAQQLLLDYTSRPNPNCLVILSCGKLTAAQKKAAWFQGIETKASVQFIWPLAARELPQWIHNRLQQHQLKADQSAVKLLIELTEGNLLATNQAIQKLALLYAGQHIGPEQVTHVIHDSAQFNVFDLAQHVLCANTLNAMRAIDALQASGGEAVLVLWALARELRELYTLIFQYQRGVAMPQLLAKQWAVRKPVLQRAIQRLSLDTLKKLLQLAHETDLIIKGLEPGDPWQHLKTIAMGMAGAQA